MKVTPTCSCFAPRRARSLLGLTASLIISIGASAAEISLNASDGFNASSFALGTNWVGAAAPVAGNTYRVGPGLRLRTPPDTVSRVFAGDSLTIANGYSTTSADGASTADLLGLTYKSSGSTAVFTVNNLILAGGSINHLNAIADVFNLAGNMSITGTSVIRAKQGTINVSAAVSGTSDLYIGATDGLSASRSVTFSGNNTFSGNIITRAASSTFTLASTGSLKFSIGAVGVNNKVSGPGTANFSGSFILDLTNASKTIGDSWTLVDTAAVVETFSATFSIPGFTEVNNEWTGTQDGAYYRFSEATGVLTVISDPSSDQDGDGLLDVWEILYFSDITAQNGSGDPDGDGITNEQEETGGSNPTVAASTPSDIDGDGLADSWEVTNFGNTTSQSGAGDFDGDGATNDEEETAASDPTTAASWPDTDSDGLRDVWERSFFTTLTAENGSGDADGDGASNVDEMRAGSSPNNINWTPTNAILANRWSFNGDLNDSVGTSNATIVDPDSNAAVGGTVTQNATSVTLSGGASGTSAAVKLGSNLIGGRTEPVTIELWATQNAVQNWGRIFDFGSGTTEYLFMSWTRGTTLATDQVEWVDAGVTVNRGTTGATSYTLGTQHHIVLTLTPASYTNGELARGTRVTWYVATSISTGTMVATGTFNTTNTLATFSDVNNWLGRSMWTGDNVANATYDEVRIWNGALTSNEINTYQLAGPNAFSFVDTDSDGLSDPWEEAFFGNLSQTADADPDTDGQTNAQEYAGGSNPNVTASVPGDVDGDGLPDNWETQYFGNLLQTPTGDPDGDIATNLQEYVGFSNPTSNASYPDDDFDFLNDAWEVQYFGSITAQNQNGDPDDDGYDNAFEYNNSLDPNNYLSSPDSDTDGLVDGWEILYFKQAGESAVNDRATILARASGTDDTDTDGFINSLESAYATNPALANSVPGDINSDGVNDGPVLKLGGDVLGTASFDSPLNWSDSAAPLAGKTYIVGVNGLRTPGTGSPVFAGDKLVLTTAGTNVGTLIWKTNSPVNVPVLQLDGGTINQAATVGSIVTLEGSVQVSKNSTLWANNGGFSINSTISGAGRLALTGSGGVTFTGANSWNGTLDIAGTTNRFTLGSTGALRFTPGAAGVTNAIAGTGGFTLNGAFTIDTSAASTTLDDSWTLTANTGPKVYGATFSVTGYTPDSTTAGTRKWTSNTGPTFYRFDEATGVLTVVSNPDTDADGLADAWEIQYFGADLSAQNGSGDPDGDGATNAQEYAVGSNPTSNTSFPDSDADGVNDAWEIATFGNLTTATVTDKDGDGLLDTWEVALFSNIAAQNGSGDPDSDGFNNEVEETAASNPTLAASTPTDINADGFADGRRLLVTDDGGTSSFNSGLNWQGAAVPAAGESFLVNVIGLRTPADANAYSFAGDRLVIFTGGSLIIKGTGALTFPGNLVLDGGRLHNATNANAVVTLEGAITVRSASEIYAQNRGFLFNAVLSGSGTLNLTGANMVTLAGANTFRGGINLTNTAGLTLASTGSLTFAPGAIASVNAITGTNPAVLNGTFVIDTASASTATGASWTLVATTGVKTYGATFSVSGYTSDGAAAGARKWTSGIYQFDEATHTLSVVGVPLSALQSWRVTNFGDSANSGNGADSADPDNDGLSNLLEYATGTLPNSANSGSVVTVARSGGVLTLTFNNIADASLTYVVEASNDLSTWSPAQTYTGLTASGNITYTDNVTLSGASRRFLRLKITAP